MRLILEKIDESPAFRVIIYAVIAALLGWGGSAGVAWFHGEPSVVQEVKVDALTKRMDQHDVSDQSIRESLSRIVGAIDDLNKALTAENENRRREEDKMDERVKYLERHRP